MSSALSTHFMLISPHFILTYSHATSISPHFILTYSHATSISPHPMLISTNSTSNPSSQLSMLIYPHYLVISPHFMLTRYPPPRWRFRILQLHIFCFNFWLSKSYIIIFILFVKSLRGRLSVHLSWNAGHLRFQRKNYLQYVAHKARPCQTYSERQ